ncbi:metal-dependent hydrolase [Halosimplex salinum]|uniref:metal-dependent hydrolase n=1 Tax=Halosimplex salinum TaxID=1710538 RepID=UPI000F4AA410|nr:metal-dependent hydrolase [Halosimplex salinum]
MYRNGHLGAALLVYAPLGGALLAGGFEAAALVGGGVMLALAGLPDVDHRIPFVEHRGCTHSVAFALLVGAVLGGAGVALGLESEGGNPAALGAFGFVLGTLAVVTHLLADVVTPKGITPFWPVSDVHYTLSLTRADNVVANYVLLTAGVAVTAGVLLVAGS